MQVRNGLQRPTAFILLGQGKLGEARQTIQRTSDRPLLGRDLLQTCLDPQQTSQLDRTAKKSEAFSLALVDPRSLDISLALCCHIAVKRDAAVRLLRSAIEQNYCAYTALQTDPLLVKFRRTPEFGELLSGNEKVPERGFGAQRPESALKDADLHIPILKEAKAGTRSYNEARALTYLSARHSIPANARPDHLALPHYRETRRWRDGCRVQSRGC